ncbi:hypothetical protein BKA70DRAFT_1254593 [Coprinopsis sp. MPI-PUGE-AT-0042]|nr:hypothetical protein BKA70DRAFT_1254593 [Coprinopsis sp. MPI-PUGE-AT-0042]
MTGSTSYHTPHKQTLGMRKSTATLRGSSAGGAGGSTLANGPDHDAPNGAGRHHSLAHELAVALMPEPSAGSKLLAEEFGIEFDEGAEGIDETEEGDDDDDDDDEDEEASDHPPQGRDDSASQASSYDHAIDNHFGQSTDEIQFASHDSSSMASFADELQFAGSNREESVEPYSEADEDPDLDPAFNTTPSRIRTRQRTPEKDAIDVLSENLEFADKFITQLRTLDTDPGGSSSQQPNLERLAANIVRRINDTAKEREGQVRDLFDCEREFKKIGGEVNGGDVLGQLEELEQIEDLIDLPTSSTTNPTQSLRVEQPRQLHTLEEEPASPAAHHTSHNYNDWELDPEANHLGDAEYDHEPSPPTSPVRDAFPPPPQLNGPVTPAKVVIHMSHIRTFTASLASSLSSISEHAQVTGVATGDAGRKIRSLKNKLTDLKTDWESAERSKVRIERWEAGMADSDSAESRMSVPMSPSRSRRIDGRKMVQEHLKAFEQALVEAGLKTQAIMARG